MLTGDKLIEVKDLKKYYNEGAVKALDGVSLDINKGDVVVVIGPSGSGKSTLLRSLNLLEQPSAGAVVFESVDITQKRGPDGKKLNLDLYRQKMGMVFQHFNLFPHKTVLENMTIAPTLVKKADRRRQRRRRWSCCGASDWRTEPGRTPRSSPAGRSSASPSCARLRWSLTSCSSTSRPAPLTPKWWARCWTS